VYDRRYAGKILAFEPSGGLLNAALVMRDRETDSWWSIMTGDAIGGALTGTSLVEIPMSEKTQWGDWKTRYPDTKILSVEGAEHSNRDPYEGYFKSDDGFRDLSSEDNRLRDKASIFAFQFEGVQYAVAHSNIEGGAVFSLGNDKDVFLYREPGSAIFASTVAYVSGRHGKKSRFIEKGGFWHDAVSGDEFSGKTGFASAGKGESARDEGADPTVLARLAGFDTFWYIWSTTHDHVMLLEPSR
jgi:hypothetical protein